MFQRLVYIYAVGTQCRYIHRLMFVVILPYKRRVPVTGVGSVKSYCGYATVYVSYFCSLHPDSTPNILDIQALVNTCISEAYSAFYVLIRYVAPWGYAKGYPLLVAVCFY